ncbi:hypothetical protein [Actinospongicola halichondriae]|uniref:hypothetical protein n=1 Tax=Actinospongicola halichondriae TaxID=3236844 RepID=UPI003D4A306A
MASRPQWQRLMAGGAAVLLALGACSDGGSESTDATTTTAASSDGDTTSTTASDDTPDETDSPTDLANALFMAPPHEGATLTVEETGTLPSTTEITVVSVEESAAGVTVKTSEVVSGGSGSVTVERSYTTGPDGSLSISAAGFFASAPGFEVTATGDDVRIPAAAELASGASASGNTFVEFQSAGIDARSDVTYMITGGGVEEVTTPLGTFQAQIVTLDLTISNSLAGEQTGTVRYEFLPHFGVLRTQLDLAGIAITSTVTSSSVSP